MVKGIGDDCAVITIGGPEYLLVTTDLFVEKVHFLMDWATPESIGAKVLATNISDIAACGGVPRDAFVSIAVPEHIGLDWLEAFYAGMAGLARSFAVNVLGGDTTRSRSDFVANIALTGLVPVSEVLFRHTARPNDLIVLTGPTGESAAGAEILLERPRVPPDVAGVLVRAHLEPVPHVLQGRILAASGACTAAIDVSDGISSDLGHICRDSEVAAVVYEDKLPVSDALRQAGTIMGKDLLDWILNGGEDYVLLAAVDPDGLSGIERSFKEHGLPLFPIGEFCRGSHMELIKKDDSRHILKPGGWDHFK